MTSNPISRMSLSGGGGLKAVPGGPSLAAINSINEQAKNAAAGNNYALVNGSVQASNEFPYVPFARDNYDDISAIKRQFQEGGAKAVVTLDKDDADYALRQRAQVENADFDRWVMQKWNLQDPAQNFLMQTIAPDQFQRRLDLIETQQSLVSKYARLRLLGPKSLEDLKFEWLVETGRITLPKGPVWDPVAWMDAQYGHTLAAAAVQRGVANRAQFKKGLFNPLRYLDENSTGWAANEANRSDIRGTPNSMIAGQMFGGSDAQSAYQYWGKPPIYSNVKYNNVPGVPGVAFSDANADAIGDLAPIQGLRNDAR